MLDLQCEFPGVLLGFPPLYYKIRFQKASKKNAAHRSPIFMVNNGAVSSNKRLDFMGLWKNPHGRAECPALWTKSYHHP
jgi:hypothetical protein